MEREKWVGCNAWEFDGVQWVPGTENGGRRTEDRRRQAENAERKADNGERNTEGGKRIKDPNGGKRKRIHSYRDLDVFNLAYTLAMEVFHLTTRFPKEERYALVDQMRRSSRSVCGTIVEGFAKRRYANVLKNALNDSLGESQETKLWADFALDCSYIQADEHKMLSVGYNQVSAMLWTLMTRWETVK